MSTLPENPSTPPAEAESPADEGWGLPFLVVGVGASAGGLEAFTELIEALPAQPGLALLLVSHMMADQKSHLADILARTSQMPVREVRQGMAVEVNQVYVIPPGTDMVLVDGHLKLTPRVPGSVPHMPVDHLFRSLATLQKSRAVGVVLSGNGSDGALAMQAIKAAGGVTFAQDEKTAKCSGMPRAAVMEGSVDHVLRPRDIARHIEQIARHPYSRADVPAAAAPGVSEADAFSEVVSLLRSRLGVDFANYKQTTIVRRIQRRMALRNIPHPGEYLALLREEAGEVQNLYQDFLIRVTQFFRDPEAFEALKEKVFPTLLDRRDGGSTVRIWVAGCSTGEEVYSIAMSLLEYLDGRGNNPSIKILATDLNELALEKARSGVYVDNIEIDLSPERLRRFFSRVNGHYQISKSVRDLCVFSRHNLANDPPFSRLDLVSCRNVLIYMGPALQKRVMQLVHYALNPAGFLFLGTSENVGSNSDLFDVVDPRHRIFTHTAAAGGPLGFFSHAPVDALPPAMRPDGVPLWSALDVQKEADRVLLARYCPVGVVVDETMTVLQFRGRTAPYLEPAPGMASLDLFRMLREGLLAEVRGATLQARTENKVVTREGVRLMEDGAMRLVRVEVIPLRVPPSGVRFFLVLFQESAAAAAPESKPPAEAPSSAADEQLTQLQQEIGALREYLQSIIEEQESTNEELKSANEEILSANEELQSTNEELQTAKEEAQSANEELATVNDELLHRNAELARANNDLVNLLSSVGIPIVMVSRDLRIRRFTPLAEKAFNLIASDIGRPITDIKPAVEIEDFPGLIIRVIDSLTSYEGTVRNSAGQSYTLRIRPYVTLDNKIDGASIVLLDGEGRSAANS